MYSIFLMSSLLSLINEAHKYGITHTYRVEPVFKQQSTSLIGKSELKLRKFNNMRATGSQLAAD